MLKSILKRSLTLVGAALLCSTFSVSARTSAELQHEYQLVRKCAQQYSYDILPDVKLHVTHDDSIYARASTSRNTIHIHQLPAYLLTNAQLHFILAHELAHIIYADPPAQNVEYERRADRITHMVRRRNVRSFRAVRHQR